MRNQDHDMFLNSLSYDYYKDIRRKQDQRRTSRTLIALAVTAVLFASIIII